MKKTVESFLHIDVRQWQRQSLLASGNCFTWHWIRNNETVSEVAVRVQTEDLILSYRNRAQSIKLATTSCHFGGCRYWFRCPACSKRAEILYAGDSRFACRRCHNLNYETQHQELHERLAKKAHGIRDQLGWPRGFNNGTGPKPKGMHQRTYERLSIKAETAVEKCNVAARARFPDYDGFG